MKKSFIILLPLLFLIPVPGFTMVQGENGQVSNTVQRIYQENSVGVKERIRDFVRNREMLKEQIREQERQEIAAVSQKVGNRLLLSLEKKYNALKSRIAKMSVITEQLKNELLAKIEAEVQKIESLRMELAAAKDITEVKAITDRIRVQVKASQQVVKDVVQAIHLSHYQRLYERLSAVYEKLSAKVSTLKEGGKDVALLEELLQKANVKLEEAKTALEAKNIQATRTALQESRLEMVKITKEIKSIIQGEED